MFPRFARFSAELMRNQWRSEKELVAYQEKKFLSMVRFAYSYVPYYREKYRAAGIVPDDIRSLSDIRKLPFVTKEDLKTVPLESRVARGTDMRRCSIARTSGSTGEPLKVAVDEETADFVRAYHLRRFLALGFMPWHKMVILGPSRRSIVTGPVVSGPAAGMFWGDLRRMLDHRVRYLSVDSSPRRQLEFFESFRPDALLGPPSYFKMLAKTADGSQGWHPGKVLTWGEILDEATKKAVKRSLGAEVFDGYGCTEVAPVGGLAWECPAHAGMHVNIDCIVLEVLKDEEPVADEESGEVVVTALYRHATPMIRYRLGDAAVFAGERCPCGRAFPLIRNLEGRMVDFLVTSDGRMISPYYIATLMEHVPGVSMFRVVQDRKDHVRVTIERGLGFTEATEAGVNEAFSGLLGPGVAIDCAFVDRIDRERGRKFKAVSREIPVDA
jgi:phenylacetate-CoA ligase